MMTSLIKIPFAQSGDKTNPPDSATDGIVNWTSGYGADYSKDPATDTSAKRIEREEFNGILNRLSTAINEIQTNGVAPYITSADNGGSAFAYGLGAIVIYNGVIYQSLKNNNTSLPTVAADWSPLMTVAGSTGRLLRVSNMTSSSTFNPMPETKLMLVEIVGAGAGGAPCSGTNSNSASYSGGGGGGAYAKFLLNAPDIPDSIVVTIGNGGVSGGTGGTTTFGPFANALGGSSGANGTTGTQGIAGGGSGGNSATVYAPAITLVAERGSAGHAGFAINTAGGTGGHGADSPMGTGGRGAQSGAGQDGGGNGSGGGGCFLPQGGSTSTQPGGVGGKGACVVYEFS